MSRTLLEQWKDIAYDESADRATLQRFWGTYFQIEKEIYEQFRQKDAELSLQEKKSIIETKKREQEYLRNLKSVENVTLVTDDTKNRGGFSIADCVKKRNK